MMKKLLILCCVLFGSISMFAQHRSEQEAIQIAQDFFKPRQAAKEARLAVVPQQEVQAKMAKMVKGSKRAAATQNSSCYIINDEANNRFVIVSADERMYKILGYSDSGVFDTEKIPDALIDVLGWYENDYELLSHIGDKLTTSRRVQQNSIAPLISSKWGQGVPFNAECPLDAKGETSASGCVATAMAQVMNYYKYPKQGKGGTISYKTTLGSTQSLNFDNLTFNWSNISDVYGENSSQQEKDEVAKLIHACGVSVFMEYNTSSGANPGTIPYAMINNFGYNENLQYVVKDYYSNQEWHSMIRTELEAKRPILYGGSGSNGSGGHRFILDGMNTEGLYHFNFGWNGDCDGFYSIDALNPGIDFLGTFIPLYDFNTKQGMVIGISPETTGEPQDVFFSLELRLDTIIRTNSSTSVKYQPYCCSNATSDEVSFDGIIGLGVFDKDWNFVKSLASTRSYFTAGTWTTSTRTFNFRYDNSTFTEKSQYYIALYAKHAKSEKPTRIRTLGGEKDWYRSFVKNDTVFLSRKDTIIPDSIPEIKIDTLPKVKTGVYDASALDMSNNRVAWSVTLIAIDTIKGEYVIQNIDTALLSRGLNPEECIVSANVNANGDIQIPNQPISGNYYLKNFSSSDDITVIVLRESSSLKINDAWGIVDKSNNSTISRYTETKFQYATPKPIPIPAIFVDNKGVMTISCDDAEVYYTVDGSTPSNQSLRYKEAVQLSQNGTIKAIAYKEGKASEVVNYNVDVFVVSKPVISESGNNISISYADGAKVYYTTNGSKPSEKTGIEYKGSFVQAETATILAIAIRKNWRDSEIDTLYHVVVPEVVDMVVNNAIAGELVNLIPEKSKYTITSLTVSGLLNGTDIKLLREMCIDGKLAYLDIKATSIVEGGEAYYTSTYGDSESTENNVIGQNMFSYCKNLVSLKLPDTVIKISGYSFSSCNNLAIVELPKSLTVIKDNAFRYCKNMTSFAIPANVEEIGDDNFTGCQNLKEFVVAPENSHFMAIDGILYKGKECLAKFPMGKQVQSLTSIPNTVKSIGENAFSNSSIENIQLPESVTSIGNSSFAFCSNLKSIVIPNSVETIGAFAFYGCKKLASVVMPAKLENIESYLFNYCENLREFHIGPNITNIADNAFDYCSSLQLYDVDESNSTFASVDGILYTKDMKILKACPQALYADVLKIPEGVEELSNHAFKGCGNIREFRMPKSLKTVGSMSFDECGMTSISIPDDVNKIGSFAFSDCKNLETFVFPDNCVKVESYIFWGCKNLAYVYLPASINEFGTSTFYGCKSVVTINSKIKNIDNLKVDYSTYSSAYTSFEDIADTCTWYVPSGPIGNLDKYVDKYKAQPWWVETWRIVRDAVPEVETQQSIILTADIQTFCSKNALNFTGVDGLKAYIASGFSASKGEVIMSKVDSVPPMTGLLLCGTAGRMYEVPFTETDFIYSNLFRGLIEDVEVTSGYVLSGNEFVAVDDVVTVKGGEAYLNVTPAANAPRLAIRFTDTTDLSDIAGVSAVLYDEVEASDAWYTLQGVRLKEKPSKTGIYLHGGRKVIVK